MNNFIVSARKYRPDTFDTVVGQANITHTLKNAIRNNHLAQAFLFCGPRGVGKTTTARILAKTINCTNISKDIEACNQCDSCKSFNSGQSLNIYELDAASNNSVDDIRALVEQVRYAPQGGRYKVYIIDEVHMLSASAFNAFLKTLEEPPSYAIFILATTEKHKIIPTILSRCQIFDFSRINIENIAKQLADIAKKEGVNAEEDALHVIAQKADGAMRDALSMFDQQVSFAGNNLTYKSVIENLNVLDYDYYFRVTHEILNANISAALLILNDIINYGFDGHNFISGLASHFRDLLVCQDEATLKLMEVSPSIREKYKIQAKECSPKFLLELLDIASQCDMNYRAAKHQRLHVELALMKMCNLNGDKKKDESGVVGSRQSAVGSRSNGSSGQSPVSRPPSSVPAAAVGSSSGQSPVSIVNEAKATAYAKEAKPGEEKATENEAAVSSASTKEATADKAKPQTTPKESGQANSKLQTGYSPRSSISISDSLKAKTPEAKAVIAEQKTYSDNPFTQSDLEIGWNEFNVRLKDRRVLSTAFASRKPELQDNFVIRFAVDNSAIENDLNNVKTELLTFLRQKFNNGKISLELVIDRNAPSAKKPYTQQERYDYLSNKNKSLVELKKQFDLDIDS